MACRFKAEHARLDQAHKSAAADLTKLEQRVRTAFDLLQDTHATYKRSPARVRKQLNQALFILVLLDPEVDDIRIELNELCATLWGLTKKMLHSMTTSRS